MKSFLKVDWLILAPMLVLFLLSGMTISSIAPSILPVHILHIVLGLIVFWLASRADLRLVREASPWLYLLVIMLLVVTIIFGAVTRGAVRWISLGPLTIQSSEVAKPLLLVFFAWLVTRSSKNHRFVAAAVLAALSIFLIFIQPDLGSALVVLIGFFGVVFMAGIPMPILISTTIVLAAISPVAWNFLADYQKVRLESFISPQADPLGSGYNSIQAMIAVGSGGLLGRGLGQGTQSQLAFLPERHTDFIFAGLSEELGFLGAVVLLLSFTVLFWRLIWVLRRTSSLFERTFLGGAFFLLFSQAAINIGMNTGLLPITGIPLPFVSAGGSSILFMSLLLGLAAAISTNLPEQGSLGIIS